MYFVCKPTKYYISEILMKIFVNIFKYMLLRDALTWLVVSPLGSLGVNLYQDLCNRCIL